MRKPLILSRCLIMTAVLGGMLPNVAHADESTLKVDEDAREESVLTVYSDNFAQVQDTYDVKFQRGEQTLVLKGFPLGIDPGSLNIDGKGLRLHSLSVQRPPLNEFDYLKSMVGKKVKAVYRHPKSGRDVETDAVLVAVTPRPILKIGDRLEVDYPGRVVLPADAITTVADGVAIAAFVTSEYAKEEPMRVHYKVPGLNWQANYRAVYNAEAETLDIQGRVAVENHTQSDFEDVNLRVVAGQVNQVHDVTAIARSSVKMMAAPHAEMADNAVVPVQESGYLLYPVASDVTIKAGELKDITILETTPFPVKAVYEVRNPAHVGYSPRTDVTKQGATLRLDLSTKDDSPALPSGVMRVMTPQKDGADMLVGEVRIPHTQPGGDVQLKLGQSVDVMTSAKITDHKRVSDVTTEYSYQVTLTNSSSRPANMEVVQFFPGHWQITAENLSHAKDTANTAKWTVAVPAKQDMILSFTVQLTRQK